MKLESGSFFSPKWKYILIQSILPHIIITINVSADFIWYFICYYCIRVFHLLQYENTVISDVTKLKSTSKASTTNTAMCKYFNMF